MSEQAPATGDWNLRTFHGRPGAEGLNALSELAAAAEAADGHPPFNEQTLVSLRIGDDAEALWGIVALPSAGPNHDDDEALGAAVVTASPDAPPVIELVVRPDARGHGIGGSLAQALADAFGGLGVENAQAWSHGDDAAAGLLAARHGLTPVRELFRLRRAASAPVPAVQLPAGVTLRAFEPGRDEAAWLRVNAAAFAHHPEQGRMSLADLTERERSDWFDAAGFLLAVDAEDNVLGFHWTKIHPGVDGARPLGEVYAVGISPEAQGRGLGRALTQAGLEYLSTKDLGAVMLYVDGDNAAALRLYESLGFTRWDADVMYARAEA